MESFVGQLSSALAETDAELHRLSDADSDDDSSSHVARHREELLERQETLRSLLTAVAARSQDEVELKEEWSAEDERVHLERQGGRRVAHTPGHATSAAGPDGVLVPDELPARHAVKERISERPADPRAVLAKDAIQGERVLQTDLQRRPISRDDQGSITLCPPGK